MDQCCYLLILITGTSPLFFLVFPILISVEAGRDVKTVDSLAPEVQQRFGEYFLELGYPL